MKRSKFERQLDVKVKEKMLKYYDLHIERDQTEILHELIDNAELLPGEKEIAQNILSEDSKFGY